MYKDIYINMCIYLYVYIHFFLLIVYIFVYIVTHILTCIYGSRVLSRWNYCHHRIRRFLIKRKTFTFSTIYTEVCIYIAFVFFSEINFYTLSLMYKCHGNEAIQFQSKYIEKMRRLLIQTNEILHEYNYPLFVHN